MSVLVVEGLRKAFGGFAAVDGVSLRLEQGELRGLIGSNGAGKSTLLDLIYGRLAADVGTITFNERDVTGLPAYRRARLGMGLVLQVPSIFGGLSVIENLGLGALPKGPELRIPVDRTEMERTLDLVQLRQMRHHLAGHLSHGQRQWLEIGMVLLSRPRLLLLDEPTSGMTRAESHKTAGLLRDLAASRATEAMIVVEHDIEFIRMVSDQVTVMHRGAVLAEGTVAEVQADRAVQDAYLGRLR